MGLAWPETGDCCRFMPLKQKFARIGKTQVIRESIAIYEISQRCGMVPVDLLRYRGKVAALNFSEPWLACRFSLQLSCSQ